MVGYCTDALGSGMHGPFAFATVDMQHRHFIFKLNKCDGWKITEIPLIVIQLETE